MTKTNQSKDKQQIKDITQSPKARAEARKIATEIIALADPDFDLKLPCKLYSYSPPNMLDIFHHVRLFSLGILDFDSFLSENKETSLEILIGHILDATRLYLIGLEHMSQQFNTTPEEISKITDESTILSSGIESVTTPEKQYPWQYLALHALYRTNEFLTHYRSSYKSKAELRTKKGSEVSHRAVIDAAGSLISAQSSLEKALSQLVTNRRISEVNYSLEKIKAMEEAEKQRLQAEKTQKSRAGSTIPRHFQRYHDHLANIAETTWSTEKGTSPNNFTSMAELHRTASKSFQPTDADRIPNESQTWRSYLRPIATKLEINLSRQPKKKE